jgi:hypothetical protein
MRLSLGLGAMIAVTPVSAGAQEICASLGQIVQASREEPAFASVQEALERGEAPMLWSHSEECTVTPGEDVSCRMSVGSGGVSEWEEIGTCPEVVEVEPLPVPRRNRNDVRIRAYVVAGLRLEYGSRCMACRVRPFGFSITFDER